MLYFCRISSLRFCLSSLFVALCSSRSLMASSRSWFLQQRTYYITVFSISLVSMFALSRHNNNVWANPLIFSCVSWIMTRDLLFSVNHLTRHATLKWQPNDRKHFSIGSIGGGPLFFWDGREVLNQFLGDMNFIPRLEVVHDFWWAIACAIIFLNIKSQNSFYLFTSFNLWSAFSMECALYIELLL